MHRLEVAYRVAHGRFINAAALLAVGAMLPMLLEGPVFWMAIGGLALQLLIVCVAWNQVRIARKNRKRD